MMVQVIIIFSIVVQFLAAFYALKLLKLTGFRYSWICISLALMLMVMRRGISLYYVNSGNSSYVNFTSETIGLLLSVFMLLGIYGIGPIFIERRNSEESIRKLLADKEILIRELYHRTKNTMQVIRGLMTLQAAEFTANEDIQKLVNITNNRIEAMSLVHQKLYQSNDLSRISIKEYIEELCSLIIENYSDNKRKISLIINTEDNYFLLDIAIPLGLILNELITNSLKYAFNERDCGIITINLQKFESDKNLLIYSDNGIGLRDGFDFTKQSTLGITLIYQIGEQQLMGKVDMGNDNGFYCSIEFHDNLYIQRV